MSKFLERFFKLSPKPAWKASYTRPKLFIPLPIVVIGRRFSSTTMSDLSVELIAPNGVKYTQPTGLFINNEWVKSKSGEKITTINPT